MKIRSWLKYLFLLTVVSSVTYSCTVSSGMALSSSRKPYELAYKPFNVEAVAFNQFSSTTLYLNIDKSHLLYTRESSTLPFVAKFSLKVDTLKFSFNDTLKSDSDKLLKKDITFPSGADYLEIILTDNNRNVSEKTSVKVDDYLVWDLEKNSAIKAGSIETGKKIMIHSPGVDHWEVYLAHPTTSLPAPPFSGSRNPLDTVRARPFDRCDGKWTVVDGCQFLYNPETNRNLIINGRTADFPKSINVVDLINSTRYIATRAEYEKLQTAEHPKLALDEFWLKCGGNENKAKRLISTYYDRVEEANTFFSGMQEGWRTDRGMVHIVMGVPDMIRRFSWREVWIYGDEGASNCIIYVFNKKSHDLDDNIFILDRNIAYRGSWDRMVTAWRNGRI